MAGETFKINVKVDTRQLVEKMTAAKEAFHPVGLLKAIGEKQMEWINENFRSEGGNVGGWAPLAEGTIAGRRGGSSAILQDTGKLRESFFYEVDESGRKVSVGTGVKAGTNVQYASYHEEGTGPYEINARPGGVLAFMGANGMVFVRHVNHPGLPQRRMLPTEPEVIAMAKEMIQAKIDQLKSRLGE